jgi:hypothetical protein
MTMLRGNAEVAGKTAGPAQHNQLFLSQRVSPAVQG